MIINIIGAGKLGKTLGYLWAQSSSYQIGGVLSTNIHKTQAAVQWMGQGLACQHMHELPHADMTLIATPDDNISAVVKELYHMDTLPPQHIVFHCSGSLNHHILKHPTRDDIYTGAVHPPKSFMDPEKNPPIPQPTPCAIECDAEANFPLTQLFATIGYQAHHITSEKKALYHAGCVFASNYLVAIAHQAESCFVQSGLEPSMAKAFTQTLLQSSLHNILLAPELKSALTGPIQRGDTATLIRHLDILSDTQQKEIYQQLGQSLIELTLHDPKVKDALFNILKKTS